MQFWQAVQSFFQSVWDTMVGVVKSFGLNDLLDILLVTFLVYKAIQIIRETRAAQLIKGILLLCVAWVLAQMLNLRTITLLLQGVFSWGIVAVIVLFQPELRRTLERVGRTKVGKLNIFSSQSEDEKQLHDWEHAIDTIASAAETLSMTKTGALIVFERQSRLGEQIDTGVEINAEISQELIGNIFFKNSPLHDGAMIIRDARILAASCFLPKPQKEELIARELGSRHRAAIGMSENSDAIILVVSEETGAISIAENGVLTRNYNKETLAKYLKDKIIPHKPEEKRERKLWRVKKK